MLETLVALQGIIREQVGDHIRAFSDSRDGLALLSVLPLGIVFGAVHALTPGHSKTVLATYVAGTTIRFTRAIAVASALAATHVVMAVIIALFALPLVVRTLGGAGDTPLLDTISRALIGVIGLWLIVQALMSNPEHNPAHGRQGLIAGMSAGLIPCPLTLFVMTFAMARGVPEIGLAFAASMLIGIAITLIAVAMLAVAGGRILLTVSWVPQLHRILGAAAGVALVGIATLELTR